jgi:hypothetical protein
LPTDDIAISDDSNVNTKKTKKLSKYKYLKIAVSKMCNVRTKIMPVTIGALGTTKKGFDQNRQFLQGHRSATELQKVKLMRNA